MKIEGGFWANFKSALGFGLGAPQLKSFLIVDKVRRHVLARLAAERQKKMTATLHL